MPGSGISFSLHEMIRIHGQPARLIAGNRMMLSTATRSGLNSCRARASSRSTWTALSTTASQTGTT